MRIITGSAKGAKLKTPRGMAVRPTADRVKESLFNILGSRVEAASVLDLFAGTGNLGLEALSRGAGHATFVEQSMASIALIRDNAALTKLQDRITIVKANVLTALERLEGQFDLVFCDPPYNRGLVNQVLTKIDTASILADNALVVLEHSQHEQAASGLNQLQLVRQERFGETCVGFWRKIE
ncbi:MAG: 16S rRNA (guanine(966)-N(2))-methyltransferase RsmD [Sporomusaceae bacterium]|nr:16S rRNA (guanine(966)-N(2))-methyltransferase RsmD [Sporomusaceae bacterium]